MKAVLMLTAILSLAACSHKMHGTVTDDLKVRFSDGVIGACVFDNEPHPGDLVTMNDDGRCHDVSR